MSNRSILIVTPYFAPQSHAAVFRAHKLAKYLPQYGWKPFILTVDTNYLYNEDASLLGELPPEVTISRTRYIEPTLRGLRMAAGGKPRTFHEQKSSLSANSVRNAANCSHGPQRVGRELYDYALNYWINSPDAHWTWYRTAVKAGQDIIRQHDIDVVYSTALPYTDHRIAAKLQDLGPKWVADFRDPVAYAAKMSSRSARIRNRQYRIVQETLERADAVTVLSSSYALIFQDIYRDITKRPIIFIPTGVDDALLPTHQGSHPYNEQRPYLIFVGEIMPEQTHDFFSLLSMAFARTRSEHRLLVVGHSLLNRQRLEPILTACQIKDRVVFIDHLPQSELYGLIQGAAAGILVPGRDRYWWNNHAKLVDYVGLRKPVVALVPDPSEARSVLLRTNLGIFLDGPPEHASAKMASFLNGTLALPQPIAAECDRYLASSQVKLFVDVFESLL